MHTPSTPPHRILILPASTRTGSLNRALAERIAARFHPSDSVAVVDLADYPMPLYAADLESAEGIPATVSALAARLAAAETLVLVSPEYNGTFSPLLKNTVDWITRIDTAAFAHLRILLASASPGAGGGANGVEMVRTWLTNMGIAAADEALCVAQAAVDPDGAILGVDDAVVDRFVRQAAPERLAA